MLGNTFDHPSTLKDLVRADRLKVLVQLVTMGPQLHCAENDTMKGLGKTFDCFVLFFLFLFYRY